MSELSLEGGKNQYIASISCRCVEPSGVSREVMIGVSSPQPHEGVCFSCSVNLPDRDAPYEIYGGDSLQALSLAMRFASLTINHLLSQGWVFYQRDDEGERVMEWSAYFLPGKHGNA